MRRSSSTSRISADPPPTRSLPFEGDALLPMLNPQSDVARRVALRARFAANAIHAIPAVLILCVLVLWLFSIPE